MRVIKFGALPVIEQKHRLPPNPSHSMIAETFSRCSDNAAVRQASSHDTRVASAKIDDHSLFLLLVLKG